jgi:hypothetical protein
VVEASSGVRVDLDVHHDWVGVLDVGERRDIVSELNKFSRNTDRNTMLRDSGGGRSG